jgi:hypothetical protein
MQTLSINRQGEGLPRRPLDQERCANFPFTSVPILL